MRVAWSGNRCLFCLRTDPLTLEHIIPEALGGKLTCKFLCQKCNSESGATFEAQARFDPTIQLAAEKLRSEIPNLAAKLSERQTYLASGAGPTTSGFVRDGEYRVKAQKLSDGSLIQPPDLARKAVESILKKSGVPPGEIESTLKKFDAIPDNCRATLYPGLEVINWATDSISLDLSNNGLADDRVPLKIAFEFLACHLGTAMYDSTAQFIELRDILRNGTVGDTAYRIERLNATEFKPFHGIFFEGNDPHATIMIRLFGCLAFQVHFLKIAAGGLRFVYTHQLRTGEESVNVLD